MRSNAARLTRVRPAGESDLPAVVRLFHRAFPNNGWGSEAACAAYFREILFGNPWYDPEIPSLVAETAGCLTGFFGIVPRPMVFRGRPLRLAVGCCFMVDPGKANALTALELLRAHLAGPQDLTLSDGLTAGALRMWTRVGGRAPVAYNLHWLRPLRPARYAMTVLSDRRLVSPALATGLRPFAAAADALAARLRPNRFLTAAGDLVDEPLPCDRIDADLMELVGRKALQPAYDACSFAWLLDQAAGKPRGHLRARRVLDRGRPLGWYIYYLCRDRVSEVVQLAARDDAYERVLQALFVDAWRGGAMAVRGRADPDGLQALSRLHCWMRWEEPATAVHSRHADLVWAIEHGDAFLSRLEGEWWMRFASG